MDPILSMTPRWMVLTSSPLDRPTRGSRMLPGGQKYRRTREYLRALSKPACRWFQWIVSDQARKMFPCCCPPIADERSPAPEVLPSEFRVGMAGNHLAVRC